MTDLLSSMLVDIVTSCAGSLLWRSEFMLDNRCWQQFMDCFLVFCPLCTNVIAVCGIFRQLNKLFFCSVDTHNFFFFFLHEFFQKKNHDPLWGTSSSRSALPDIWFLLYICLWMHCYSSRLVQETSSWALQETAVMTHQGTSSGSDLGSFIYFHSK